MCAGRLRYCKSVDNLCCGGTAGPSVGWIYTKEARQRFIRNAGQRRRTCLSRHDGIWICRVATIATWRHKLLRVRVDADEC